MNTAGRLVSPRRVELGLFLPIVQPINRQPWEDAASPAVVLDIARHAESVGLDFVTVQDHGAIAAPELASYGSARFYDPMVLLGFLAAGTERLRLATHVIQLHLRSPLVTAKALATADVVSGGRLIAGFGVGSRDYEARAARVPFDRRGSVADDYLRAIIALWSGEPATYHGPWADFDDLICAPAPAQRPRPPLWIGGNRPVGLRRALRLADAWVPWNVTPAHVQSTLHAVTDGNGLVAPDDFRIVVSWAPLGGRGPRGEPPPPYRKPGPAEIGRCLDELGHWLAAGATDFVLDLPAPSRRSLIESLDWIGSELGPAAGLTRP
jgi:probable F420-dependent oxidoreductase